jgi:hypothetical protein
MDTWTECVSAYLWIQQGTTNGDSSWLCTVDEGGTFGTSNIVFSQFSGAGQITAGTGLAKAGNVLSLANSGATAGTYTKVTVDALGRVITATSMSNADIASSLGYTPVNKAGDTMSAALVMGGNKVTGVASPTVATDAATKGYVDGFRFQYTSGTPATSHVVTHNLGYQYVNVSCVDPSTGKLFIPSDIVFNSATQLTITVAVSMNIIAVINA